MKRKVWKTCIQAVATALFLLAVWGVAYLLVGNELLVPSFSACLKEMGGLLVSAAFWRSVGTTFLRTLAAFAFSFLFAVFFAFIAYMVSSFRRFFGWIVSAVRSLPTLAVLLILLLWWGAGFAPIAVAFLSLFPILYTAILTALLGVDGELIEMSNSYNVPLKKQVTKLYLPAVAPYVAREGSGALSFALKLVVSAEVLAGTVKSLGGMMQDAKAYLDVPLLFALVAVTLILGLILESLGELFAEWLERRTR